MAGPAERAEPEPRAAQPRSAHAFAPAPVQQQLCPSQRGRLTAVQRDNDRGLIRPVPSSTRGSLSPRCKASPRRLPLQARKEEPYYQSGPVSAHCQEKAPRKKAEEMKRRNTSASSVAAASVFLLLLLPLFLSAFQAPSADAAPVSQSSSCPLARMRARARAWRSCVFDPRRKRREHWRAMIIDVSQRGSERGGKAAGVAWASVG